MLTLSIVTTVCRNWLPELKILAVLVCAVVGVGADDFAEDNDWSKTDNPWLYHQCVMYIQKYEKKPVMIASVVSNETTPPTLKAMAFKLENKTMTERSAKEELEKPVKPSILFSDTEVPSESTISPEPSSAGKQSDIAIP